MVSEKEKKETELNGNRFKNGEAQQKLHALDDEVERERRKRKEADNLIRRIKNDMLAEFTDFNDTNRLKSALARLNDKYIGNENAIRIHAAEAAVDGVSEEKLSQDRQRLYLERSLADLKHRLSNDLNTTKNNRMRIMNENAMLLRELNHLREELKIVRDKLEDYELAKQTSESRGINSIDALIQTLNADAGNYRTRQQTNELIKESEKNQREIQSLRQRLLQLQLAKTNVNDPLENISILKLV